MDLADVIAATGLYDRHPEVPERSEGLEGCGPGRW